MIDNLYKVLWEEEARNDLRDISRSAAFKLEEKINNYLVQAPKQLGKALVGQYKGLYRYRYGDYRILYEIDLDSKSIIIVRIGNRKEIYL